MDSSTFWIPLFDYYQELDASHPFAQFGAFLYTLAPVVKLNYSPDDLETRVLNSQSNNVSHIFILKSHAIQKNTIITLLTASIILVIVSCLLLSIDIHLNKIVHWTLLSIMFLSWKVLCFCITRSRLVARRLMVDTLAFNGLGNQTGLNIQVRITLTMLTLIQLCQHWFTFLSTLFYSLLHQCGQPWFCRSHLQANSTWLLRLPFFLYSLMLKINHWP